MGDQKEQALLDRVLIDFRSALTLVPACVRTLITFVAGMVCFGCNPRWDDYVWRKSTNSPSSVVAVNVSSEACIHVDQACGPFGQAVRRVQLAVMGSGLAKAPAVPLPDFSMFDDRETVCAWLRRSLAMQPLLGTLPGGAASAYDAGDTVTSAEHGGAANSRILAQTLAQVPWPPPHSTQPTQGLDPVRDGEQSGFDIDAAVAAI